MGMTNNRNEMTKCKPRELPSFIPRNTTEWLLLGAFIVARSYETNVEGVRRFQCSNPTCGHETVINARNTWLPPGCIVCGDEFDWEGIFTEKAKVCPDCRAIYPKVANFCVFHGNKNMIPLKDIEYRK